MSSNGIIISNLSRHRHMLEAAAAAENAGMLAAYCTGLYYKPSEFPYNLVVRAPRRLRDSLLSRLAGRQVEGLPQQLVADCPWIEPLAYYLLRVRPFSHFLDADDRIILANRLFERHVLHTMRRLDCAIAHCFDGSALGILKDARRRGIRTILDVVISRRLMAGNLQQTALDRSSKQNRSLAKLDLEQDLADLILVPSQEVRDSLVERGVDATKVVTLPYGVDTQRFRPNATTGRCGDGKLRILFVGQVTERKGLQYLLKALADLNLGDAELTVVGSPVDGFGSDLLNRYSGSFRAIPWWPYAALHSCYQEADVFVFPSSAEGSALVTYEAMSSGLASIVTRESGSVVRHGRDGLVVPSGDVSAIKEAILTLNGNRALVREMGESARSYVCQNFSWSQYRNRVTSIYESALRWRNEAPPTWRARISDEACFEGGN